jgi:hypothetical protein
MVISKKILKKLAQLELALSHKRLELRGKDCRLKYYIARFNLT